MFYFLTYYVLYSSILCALLYRAHSPYLFTDARVENLGCGKKERKRIYIAPFIYYVYLKALTHGSQFYMQIHHACLYFVCVHQMAPPLTEVRDI